MDKLVVPMSAHPLVGVAAAAAAIVLFTAALLRILSRRRYRKRRNEMRGIVDRLREASRSKDPLERRRVAGLVSMIERRSNDWGIPLHAALTNKGELQRRLRMLDDERKSSYPMPKFRYPDDPPSTLRSSGVPAACVQAPPLVSVVVPGSGATNDGAARHDVAGLHAFADLDLLDVPKAVSRKRPTDDVPKADDVPDTLPSAGQRRPARDTEFTQQVDRWIEEIILEDAG